MSCGDKGAEGEKGGGCNCGRKRIMRIGDKEEGEENKKKGTVRTKRTIMVKGNVEKGRRGGGGEIMKERKNEERGKKEEEGHRDE